jgi:hypothetical protein
MSTQKSSKIAHLGLCAAAAVMVASLSILIFQGSHSQADSVPTLQPAVVPAHSLDGSAGTNQAQPTAGNVNS